MTRRLRVVVYSPHFAEYSIRLGNGFARRCDVRVVVNRKDANRQWPIAAMRLRDSVSVRVRDFSLRRFGAIDIPKSFADVIGFRPDLIVLHEVPDYYTALLLRVLPPRPERVMIVHDPIPHIEGGSGTSTRLERLRPFIRRQGHLVALHGRSCVSMFERSTPDHEGRRLAVPHGVLMRETLGIPSGTVPGRILFFGRMMFYKGLEFLLDALDVMRANGATFEAVIAGRGPEIDRLDARLRASRDIVVLDDFISAERASVLFRSASVVVLPYLEATQSGVLAAAFGNGRAVVASATGGIVDIVTDRVNGLLVKPGDVMGLADALAAVLFTDNLRAALERGARDTAASVMSWDKIASEIEQTCLASQDGSGEPATRLERHVT